MVFSLSERSYFLTFQVVGNLHGSIEVLIIDVITERIGLLKHEQKSCRSLGLCLIALMIFCVRCQHCLWYSNETDHPKGFLVLS